MRPDRIVGLETFSIRLPRDQRTVRGTAGSPTALAESPFDYRWSSTNGSLYSIQFEAALVKVTLESGLAGWGEAQAPLAPDVACLIIDQLLRPAIAGEPFLATPEGIAELRERMYATMRVRGQTGGFMLDAMAAVDLALWDIAGKAAERPACEVRAPSTRRPRVPAYLSGLSGNSNKERVDQAQDAWGRGFRIFKIFHDRTPGELFELLDLLQDRLGPDAQLAVDALWRLNEETALPFGHEMDKREVLWLECPFPPEDLAAHVDLATAIRTPLALGESYRSRHELTPFLNSGCVGWIQPDLGRCGLTEALALAEFADPALRFVPHISIAMGPQIAAALHFASMVPRAGLAEYNPSVLDVANRFLTRRIEFDKHRYVVPSAPGLGVEIDECALRTVAQRPVVRSISEPCESSP